MLEATMPEPEEKATPTSVAFFMIRVTTRGLTDSLGGCTIP